MCFISVTMNGVNFSEGFLENPETSLHPCALVDVFEVSFLVQKKILYWDVSVCIYLALLPVLYAPSEVVINLVVNSINQVFAPNIHGVAYGFPAHFWWHEGVKFVSFFLFLSAISHHSLTHPPSCIVCTNYLPVYLIFLNLCKLIFPLTFACVNHANVQFSFGY